MSTPTTDRAAVVLQQIDDRISAISGNWPDESRALRCLKTAIAGTVRRLTMTDYNPEKADCIEILTAICDTWEATK
jgi:hypothetical protein